ncbi:MAG: hypothetical protein P8046_10235, partial [Anaerolineales bacterium]
MDIGLVTPGTSPRYMQRFINGFNRINLSLRSKMMLSFFIVILLLVIINALMIVEALRVNRQYDDMITNVTMANSINGFIKPAIDTEMWNIVAGKVAFEDGK